MCSNGVAEVFELFLMGVGLDFLAVAFKIVDVGGSRNQKKI